MVYDILYKIIRPDLVRHKNPKLNPTRLAKLLGNQTHFSPSSVIKFLKLIQPDPKNIPIIFTDTQYIPNIQNILDR